MAVKQRGRVLVAFGAACVCMLAVTAAIAEPLAEGPAALRAVSGTGTFTFTGKGTFGVVRGTVKTTVVPASIKPGEGYRMTMELSWAETGQSPTCQPGTIDGQTHTQPVFPLVSPIRPGHGEDLLAASHIVTAAGDTTIHVGDSVTTCGASATVRETDRYEVHVDGSITKGYNPSPSCVAPYPSAGTNIVGDLGPDSTFEGTFAVLSIGGADCTASASTSSGGITTDTFTAAGQTKPHAVAVPANRTRAEITLRWSKPGSSFTITGVTNAAKRATSSVARGEKLKITFSRSPTSLTAHLLGLSSGTLRFRVTAVNISGTQTTVTTRVALKA